MYRLCEVSFPAQPSQVKATLVFPQGPVYSLFKLPQTPPAAAPTSPPSQPASCSCLGARACSRKTTVCGKGAAKPQEHQGLRYSQAQPAKGATSARPRFLPMSHSSQTSRSSRRLHTHPTCCLSCPQPPAKHRPPSGQGNGIVIVMQQKRKP